MSHPWMIWLILLALQWNVLMGKDIEKSMIVVHKVYCSAWTKGLHAIIILTWNEHTLTHLVESINFQAMHYFTTRIATLDWLMIPTYEPFLFNGGWLSLLKWKPKPYLMFLPLLFDVHISQSACYFSLNASKRETMHSPSWCHCGLCGCSHYFFYALNFPCFNFIIVKNCFYSPTTTRQHGNFLNF